MKNIPLRSLATVLLLAWGTLAHAAPADEIRALLEKGQTAEAYELGRQHQDQLGEPAFDFYYGVAAIGSGRAGEGVLALERFVVNAPNNLNGRLELARGYFVLGEDSRAREEFQLVLAANPPPEVQANVQRFLDAIRSREFLYRPTAGAYVEAGLGYDSNANAGVGSGSIVRWTLPIQIQPGGLKKSDTFNTLGAGFNWSRPLKPGMYVVAGGAVDGKFHHSESVLNQHAARLDGGLTWIRQKDLWRLGAGFSTLYTESDHFRDTWSLSGEWHRQLDELRAFNVFGQYADFRYTGGNSLRNSGLTTLGVGYRQALVSPMQPLLSASAYVGREDVRPSQRADLSRDLLGLRVSASITPAPKWSLMAGVSYQQSNFDGGAPPPPGINLPPEPPRKDDYTAVDLTVSYAMSSNLTLKGLLVHSRNSSNDALSAYERDIVGVNVRYDFK